MDHASEQIYEFGDFRLDAKKRLLLRRDGETVRLKPKVFETLLYLVQNRGKVLEKDDLLSAIWSDTIVEENNLTQNISILRRIFGEKHGENRFIATVPGRGYKFVADVRSSADPELQKAASESKNDVLVDQVATEAPNRRHIQQKNRSPSVFLTVSGILALTAIGLMLWRHDSKPSTGASTFRTLAVLPFKPLVDENRNEALELGMTDTLISRLSINREIIVRPLSSVRRFGETEQDPQTAGRELGVESVLDGNIQRWGNKIRVNVRLIGTQDGATLWSGTFDEEYEDIFEVQDSISTKVIGALKLHIGNDESISLSRRNTANVAAYEAYMRGRFHSLKLTRTETEKGIAYFQQAIEVDPQYALAYVGLADAYRSLPLTSGAAPHQYFPKAKAAAEKAVELDSRLADAHAILGFIIFWYDWNWNSAESHLKRALELDPNSAEAHVFYAHFLSNLGRHKEALSEARQARELDPLNLRTLTLEAQFLRQAGQYDEALSRLERVLEMDPKFWLAQSNLASVFLEKGMYREAQEANERAREISGRGAGRVSVELLVRTGKRDEAEAMLDELLTSSMSGYVSPVNIAGVLNALGNTGEALNWLERGFEYRDPQMVFLKVRPEWNNLRSEPAFIDLMKRMNFE